MSRSSDSAGLRFDEKVAVVTGAGGGLGRQHALMLAARGAKVVVNDVEFRIDGAADASGASVVGEIVAAGGEAVADAHDVLDGAAIVQRALDEYGGVDIVINNAGVAGGGALVGGNPAEWDRTIATTLHGAIAVTRAAWPHLMQRGAGRVIMTASPAMWGSPGTGAYSATKSSLFGLTRSLAMEGATAGINVNCIMPSAWTRLTKLLPTGPVTDLLTSHYPPEAVASFVVWLCHASTTITGETFSVGGGRAARVFLGEARGGRASDASDPNCWAAAFDDVMNLDDHGIPASMFDELSWQVQHLGKTPPSSWPS